jgi:DNA primase
LTEDWKQPEPSAQSVRVAYNNREMSDAVDEVKQRLNIEDVVGQYVQLKRAGRNFKGLSPFTNEKSASFIVSPEKQIWHDFSSGKGGNMFSFVMEVEGLDFKTALEMLARQAGVDLTRYQRGNQTSRDQDKQKLYALLELTAKFYQTHLTKNRTALEYLLRKRAFAKGTLLDFQIGYAPSSGTALVDFLRKQGFSDSQMKAAGVATTRARGLSDMFRERVIIPLADSTGRVIGFTARLLIDDPNAPKYINTPQTVLYDKSRHIFGLHLAKEAIRKNHYAVIVEGNLDVMASHQAGVRQVVATAGTAITEYHLKGLGRFTNDIRLSFDRDEAGIKASERAIPIASRVGVGLYLITIPSGKDPDELIRQDPIAWQKAIEQPEYSMDWLITRYQQLLDVSTGAGKRQFSDVLLRVVEHLDDQVEQEHYLQKIAAAIGASTEALQAKLHQQTAASPPPRRRIQHVEATDQQTTINRKAQNHFMVLTLMRPELRILLQPILPTMLTDDTARSLLEFLQQNPDYIVGKEPDSGLQSITDYIKILVLQYEELYKSLEPLELHYEASRLQAQLIQEYVKTEKQQIVQRLQTADDTATAGLLEQAKQLDKLLKMNKGATYDR